MTAMNGTGEKREQGTGRRTFLKQAGLALAAGASARAMGATPVGANDRIGIGFIGCGGRGTHLSKEVARLKEESKRDDIEIVAVCDTYRPRMEKLATVHNAKGYFDHRELLADPDVDVVGIATPDHIHGYQVLDAVAAGKDVYCEKPFTHWRQFELTKQVVEAVKNSSVIFQLGTQGMSDSAWHQAGKLVQEGLIGQPIHAECGYFRVGDWGERGMSIDDPNAQAGQDLNWDAFLGDAPKRPFDVSRYFRWRMYEDYSGGPVTDLFPHSLTPVIHMLGVGMPARAAGMGGKFRYEEREIPDTFNMLIDYPEKLTVAVLGTQGNDHQGYEARGSGGRCPTLRGWDGTLTFDRNEIVFTRAEGSNKGMQRFPIEHPESVGQHWANLLDCCRTREQPNSHIDLAYRVQTALHMAMLSMRGGKIVGFDASTQSLML